jgi:cyclohexadienyl dehydratase
MQQPGYRCVFRGGIASTLSLTMTRSLSCLWVLAVLWAGCASQPARPAPLAVLRVGTSGDYPPFSDWKQERPSGFSVALLEAFATKQGLEPTWVRFRWPELSADFSAGKFDLAAGGITVRPERSVLGRYTVPVVRNGAVLLLRRPRWAPPPAGASSRVELSQALAEVRALDRPELRVAVNRGGHLERVARSLFLQAQLTAIPDNASVREALATGQVDAALTNTTEAPRWAEGLDGIEHLGPLTRDVVALWVRPDQPRLAAQLDAWLMAQEESGALGQLRARYLGTGAVGTTARPVEATSQEARVREAFRASVREAAAALHVAPPSDEALDAFSQAQIEAAKALQRRTPLEPGGQSFSLDQELRPAVARVSAKMAALVVRLPPALEPSAVSEQARDWLGASGLEAAEVEHLARALSGLRPPSTPAR